MILQLVCRTSSLTYYHLTQYNSNNILITCHYNNLPVIWKNISEMCSHFRMRKFDTIYHNNICRRQTFQTFEKCRLHVSDGDDKL